MLSISQPKVLLAALALFGSVSALPSGNAAPLDLSKRAGGVHHIDVTHSYQRPTCQFTMGGAPFVAIPSTGGQILDLGFRVGRDPQITPTSNTTDIVIYRVDAAGTRSGPVFTDTFVIGDITVENQQASNNTLRDRPPAADTSDGLIGLARSSNGFLYGQSEFQYLNVIDTAFKQGKIDAPVMGYQICPLKESDYPSILAGKGIVNSHMTWGGLDSKDYVGELHRIPISPDPSFLSQVAWTIDCVDWSVTDGKDSKVSKINNNVTQVLVQTSQDYNLCSDRLMEVLLESIPWDTQKQEELVLVPKDFKRKDGTTGKGVDDLEITLSFNDDKKQRQDFTFKGEENFVPLQLNGLYNVTEDMRILSWKAVPLLKPGQGREMLIGQRFFERYFAGFDYKAGAIDFGVNSCGLGAQEASTASKST